MRAIAGNALGYGSGTSVTQITINGGILDAGPNGDEAYLANYTLTGGSLTNVSGGGDFAIQGGYTLTTVGTNVSSVIAAQFELRSPMVTFNVGQGSVPNGVDLLISGQLTNNGNGAVSTGFVKTGAGLLELTNTNTYTGGTTLSAGSIELGNASAMQSSVLTDNVSGGLTFTTGLGTANLGGLSGSGNIALADVTGGSLTLNLRGNSSTFTTYSGVLSGGGGLNNAGGTLVLTNSSSNYTGPTTITGGALVVSNTGVLSPLWSSSGNLSVPAGATFGVEAGSSPGEFSLGNITTVLGNVGFAGSANLGIQVVSPRRLSTATSLPIPRAGRSAW